MVHWRGGRKRKGGRRKENGLEEGQALIKVFHNCHLPLLFLIFNIHLCHVVYLSFTSLYLVMESSLLVTFYKIEIQSFFD